MVATSLVRTRFLREPRNRHVRCAAASKRGEGTSNPQSSTTKAPTVPVHFLSSAVCLASDDVRFWHKADIPVMTNNVRF